MKAVERDFYVHGEPETWSSFNIITVNPLADQTDILARLNMPPEECKDVGVYWLYRDRLYFLSVAGSKERGAITCFRDKEPGDSVFASFYARVTAPAITSLVLERVLGHLSKWIDSNLPGCRISNKPATIHEGDEYIAS